MSAVGKKYFGKTPVEVEGVTRWDQQDSQQIWSDGGLVNDVMDQAKDELSRIVGDNALAAVREFSQGAEIGLRAENNDVILGLRMATNQAALVVNIPLRTLLENAIKDIRPRLGQDQEAQEAISALIALGRAVAKVGQSPAVQAPASPPDASPPRQRGAPGLRAGPRRVASPSGDTYESSAYPMTPPAIPGT